MPTTRRPKPSSRSSSMRKCSFKLRVAASFLTDTLIVKHIWGFYKQWNSLKLTQTTKNLGTKCVKNFRPFTTHSTRKKERATTWLTTCSTLWRKRMVRSQSYRRPKITPTRQSLTFSLNSTPIIVTMASKTTMMVLIWMQGWGVLEIWLVPLKFEKIIIANQRQAEVEEEKVALRLIADR